MPAPAATNDLEVARQALRDGFWALARSRAAACTNACDASREIILESWARESAWDEVLKSLAGWGNPSNEVSSYHRALALAKKGEIAGARAVYASGLPESPVYRRLSTRLLAGLSLDEGKPAEAVATLAQNPAPEADDLILLAEAKSRLGKAADASALWRRVLADTNATIHAVATAAANLGDVPHLRALATNDVPADVRLGAQLRLGSILLGKPDTFDEGAKLITGTVKAFPDASGAREAARRLAGARLRRGDWKGAATAYGEMLEIWPDLARVESVQEGLGWAYLRQGRAEEALQAFRLAEDCAATDDERATAAVKAGDALMALGRVDEATARCREALAKWPKAAIAEELRRVVRLRELELRGRALYREFRFADAQKAFAEVGAGDASRRGRMEFFEILCLFGQGLDAKAVGRARALLDGTDDPRLKADVTQWLARCAYNGGRWREAKELFVAYAASPLTDAAAAADARIWAARAALAANDFAAAIALTATVAGEVQGAPRAEALVVQGEALLELSRFDEAALVFDRAARVPDVASEVRLAAQILRADALYALGADNPDRYEEALMAYRRISQSESLTEETRFTLAYKIGLSLEKLRRRSEAVEQYYVQVVLAYRDACDAAHPVNDEIRAVFARAAFRLADLCEAGGQFLQARKTLELVAESDAPAAAEAVKRINRLRQKGVLP